MDVLHSCRCCLRCAPDRDLTTSYTHLGETEIYSDMLKECFDLHLGVGVDGSCGICSACVGRLRDARDFKLQVQRSQAELQARLQGALRVKDEEPRVKPEMADGDDTDDEMSLAPDGGAGRSVSALAREQLAMTCCVRLERLRGGEAPHASRTSLATLHESRRASRVKEPHDNTAGLRAEEAYTCDTCGKHFTGKLSLIAHVRSHLVQDEAAATYSRGTRSEKFSGDNLFLKHTQTHTRKETYSCDMCNRQFKAKFILLRHKLIHTGEKPYTCEECKKQFTRKYSLAIHKRIHTGEKPYTCEECKKQFTRKGSLAIHKTIHTGEKPYSCKECKGQFTQKCSLDLHQSIHTGIKPYSCEECNKQFTQKGSLAIHKRVHTEEKPYSCEECKKQFKNKRSLAIHKRIHTGEKPYSCNECIKQFTRKDDFVAHIRHHTQEKQHVCKICKVLVSGNSNLIQHLQTHLNCKPQFYQRRNAVKLYI